MRPGGQNPPPIKIIASRDLVAAIELSWIAAPEPPELGFDYEDLFAQRPKPKQ